MTRFSVTLWGGFSQIRNDWLAPSASSLSINRMCYSFPSSDLPSIYALGRLSSIGPFEKLDCILQRFCSFVKAFSVNFSYKLTLNVYLLFPRYHVTNCWAMRPLRPECSISQRTPNTRSLSFGIEMPCFCNSWSIMAKYSSCVGVP